MATGIANIGSPVVEAVRGKDKADNLVTKGPLAERFTAGLNSDGFPVGLKQSCDPPYEPMQDPMMWMRTTAIERTQPSPE